MTVIDIRPNTAVDITTPATQQCPEVTAPTQVLRRNPATPVLYVAGIAAAVAGVVAVLATALGHATAADWALTCGLGFAAFAFLAFGEEYRRNRTRR
jgi:hypothetical protein